MKVREEKELKNESGIQRKGAEAQSRREDGATLLNSKLSFVILKLDPGEESKTESKDEGLSQRS